MAITEKPSITDPSKATAHAVALDMTPITTSTLSSSAHELLSEIRDIYDKLSELPSLAPSETANALLKRLVNLCVAPYSSEFTTYFFKIPGVDELCKKLRSIQSEAEGELEKYWAKNMMERTEKALDFGTLESYPYFQNYFDHSGLESSVINSYIDHGRPRSMTFIGSGPLPLTSLCFLRHFPAIRIYNIDRDADAVGLGNTLCCRMGSQDRMVFLQEDVTNLPLEASWFDSDVIFLAALVGTDTKSKLDILRELAKRVRPGCLVLVRSARGMRTLLYPILELSEDIEVAGFEILAEVHPWTKTATSFVLLRVMERDKHKRLLRSLAEMRV